MKVFKDDKEDERNRDVRSYFNMKDEAEWRLKVQNSDERIVWLLIKSRDLCSKTRIK